MRNVSKKYIDSMQNRRDFYPVAQMTFLNGEVKTLSKSDFVLSGNTVTESAESSAFPIGILAAKRITISLMNDDDRWADYDFYGAKIFLQTKFDLDDGTTETLNIGTFTVVTPENYGTTISVTAMDDSYKTDVDYSTDLPYPASAGAALRDSCRKCNVTLLTTTFKNDDYIIQEKPENLTHRQLIGMIAMIAGGNAVFDEYNRLSIKSYDFSTFEEAGLDGGIFDSSLTQYQTGDTADGGSFSPWSSGYAFDGGQFGDRDNIHILYEFKSGLVIGVDDVVITGVQIEGEDGEGNKTTHLYGTEGYVLSLENQLATGKEDEVVRLIGQNIVGLKFRPFSGDHIAYPLAEFMDLAYLVERKNNIYQTVLTDVDFTYYGFTKLKCSADSPIRNSSTYYGNEVKTVIKNRQEINKRISEYDRNVQEMTKLISQGFGMYFTSEKQEDGSVKWYMHDKPTIEESSYVCYLSSNGIMASLDGGTTWAIDKNGNALFNVIVTRGIEAEWINANTLSAISADLGTVIAGILKSSNYSDTEGNFSKEGFYLNLSTGELKSKGLGIDKKGNSYFSGKLEGASGSFSGEITASSGKIGGFTIGERKIYGTSDSGKTIVMALGRNDTNTAFAAGGSSHSSYTDCPFRVRMDGKLFATNAEIKGTIRAESGGYYVELKNGCLYGGSAERNGYMRFDTINSNYGSFCTNVGGRGGVILDGACLGVGSYDGYNYSEGQSGVLQYISDIRDIGNGLIEWEYSYITFEKGLMITII